MWSIKILHIQLHLFLKEALEPLVGFQWHELQTYKSSFLVFSISSCSFPVISNKLIDYRENKQVYKQKSFGLSQWFQMVIKLIDRGFLVFLKLLGANVNYPTQPHCFIIFFVVFQQNKTKEKVWVNPPVSSYEKYFGWKLLSCRSPILILSKILFWKSSPREQNQISCNTNLDILRVF